ncbi:PaREP1 family protein [Vulcanisaeta sp. JCM 14467]|uniref:PaREP1 family protein n=1 Tax=Vulcanisaeta sp. JCM 14467 TaxID=1295370 RepID=UPI0006CF3E1F|nr:PaREP1 family protein [Vulcanisaeta sp. JCM 14467]
MGTEIIEKPLPKPTSEDYVNAKLLETLVEAQLAIEFLDRGLVRNAAGKAFQAWRALLTALLRLEFDKLLQVVRSEEERKWLMSKAVPRVPITRMVRLSQMLEEIGYSGISPATDTALNLHDYQRNGPDPDMAVSKYRDREEAAVDIKLLINELVRRIEELKPKIKWGDELENALKVLREELHKTG